MLTLNLPSGSVTFALPEEAAQAVRRELLALIQRIQSAAQATASGGIKTPEVALEYCYRGDIFLEIFCNPNIWPTPFAAKVLITLRDDRLRLSMEAELSRVLDDLNQFLGV